MLAHTDQNQSNGIELDHELDHEGSDLVIQSDDRRPVLSARDLAGMVGPLDLDQLRPHHLTLVVAVAELARDAGIDWPWGPDDPVVALLRALAKLSIVAPEATSEHAARLAADLSA